MYEYTYENLRKIAQSKVGEELVRQAKEQYEEKFQGVPLCALNYAYQKLYYRNGDRNKHQALYYARRTRLQLLQLLALSDDGYLEELEEVLAAICDEFTWVLPAHNLIDETLEYDYTVIDLFSAETGMYLAETVYIFGEKLSPDIRKRIRLSVDSKIVKNFESRTFWWEIGENNWSSVCGCGVGLAYLYLFPDRFPLVKARILQCFDCYLNGIDEEGYCSEGVGYWNYGFGFFALFYDAYTQLTEERPAVLESEKVQNLVRYLERVRMDGQVFVPFADGGAKKSSYEWQSLCAVKNLFGEAFDLPAGLRVRPTSKALGVRLLYTASKFGDGKEPKQASGAHYYRNAQVFIYRNSSYAFSAKGGHNEEFHNHNDIGAFQIVKNEKRLICDIGAGEYTKDYFNDIAARYGKEIFVCSSLSHSVPILAENEQAFGKKYSAKVLERTDKVFSLDLVGAYEKGADVLTVTYEMEGNGVRVRYLAKGLTEPITFRFVSDFAPVIGTDGTVRVENLMTIESKQNLKPVVERKPYKGHVYVSKTVETENGAQVVFGNDEEAWTIDYTASGKEVEAEFYFGF